MAPPPRYLITRNLVRRFFEKYLPRQPLETQDSGQQLFQCWEKFGVDDPRCKDFELQYDYTYKQTKNYRKKIQSLRIKEDVMRTLNKPVYSHDVKGRYRKRDKEWTIYDGLR